MELQEGVECGYKVLQVFEVWHYPKTAQYDGKDAKSGLFTEYVNKFLRLKQQVRDFLFFRRQGTEALKSERDFLFQASGWPSWVSTDADKEKYIRDYEEKEGIVLDESEIEKNCSLRSLAKLMLNSFWVL